MSNYYMICMDDNGTSLWMDCSRFNRACESAYWQLKPYRNRWQRFCLKLARGIHKPNGRYLRLKFWLLDQANA